MKDTEAKRYDAIAFGEPLLRLSPPGQALLEQTDSLTMSVGGAELNVMAGIRQLGCSTALLTRLPDHALGRLVRGKMRQCGVDDALALSGNSKSRIGTYYYQSAGFPRKPSVIYDRENSCFYDFSMDDIPDDLFQSCRLFYTSGITLALTGAPRTAALALIRRAHAAGVQIAFDVNYRASLWDEAEARAVITEVLPMVDILFVSEETQRKLFQKTGTLSDSMKSFAKEYEISCVAASQRQIQSSHTHSFSSVLYDTAQDAFYTEPPYSFIEVTDRIGSGDAYVSGVLSARLLGLVPGEAVAWGNAAAAIKCTLKGDLPSLTPSLLQQVIHAHTDTQGQTEMDR